jgi:hypothetical protein
MNAISQIVSGGGWKSTRVERVKIKAWIAFFVAIAFGCLTMLSIGSFWFYAYIPAGLSLIVSVVLFIRERPLEFESFSERAGEDPGKLYGRCGSIDLNRSHRNAEPSAAPNGGPAASVEDSSAPGGPPSVS